MAGRRPHDYLALGLDSGLKRAMASFWAAGPEDVLFSDVVTKINRKDKPQERLLMVTTRALYNLNKSKKVKRRIDLSRIQGITLSTVSDEFVVHVPSEYDYRFKGARKADAVSVLVNARLGLDGINVPVNFSSLVELRDITSTRVAPAKAPVPLAGAAATAGGTMPPAVGGAASTAAGSAALTSASSSSASDRADKGSTRAHLMSTAVGELGPIEEGDEDSEGKWRAAAMAAHATGVGMRVGGVGSGGGSYVSAGGVTSMSHYPPMFPLASPVDPRNPSTYNVVPMYAAMHAGHPASLPPHGIVMPPHGYFPLPPPPPPMYSSDVAMGVRPAIRPPQQSALDASHMNGYAPMLAGHARSAARAQAGIRSATPTRGAAQAAASTSAPHNSSYHHSALPPPPRGAPTRVAVPPPPPQPSPYSQARGGVPDTRHLQSTTSNSPSPIARAHAPQSYFELAHNPMMNAGRSTTVRAIPPGPERGYGSPPSSLSANAASWSPLSNQALPPPPARPSTAPAARSISDHFAYRSPSAVSRRAPAQPAKPSSSSSASAEEDAHFAAGTPPCYGELSHASAPERPSRPLSPSSAGTVRVLRGDPDADNGPMSNIGSPQNDSVLQDGVLSRESSLEFERRGDGTLAGSTWPPPPGSAPPVRFTTALAQLHQPHRGAGGTLAHSPGAGGLLGAASQATAHQRPQSANSHSRAGAASAARSASAYSESLGYLDEEDEEYDDDGFTGPAPGISPNYASAGALRATSGLRSALSAAMTPADEMSALDTLFGGAAARAPSPAGVPRPGSASSLGRALRGMHHLSPGPAGPGGAAPPRVKSPVPVTGWSTAYTPVNLDSFEMLRVLGRGSYGKVVLVRKKDTGEVLAMKILSKATLVARNQVEHTQSERAILESIDHPFLIKLRYAFQTPSKLYFVLPYLRGGEVFFHLRQKRRFDEALARFYIAEIALALGHMHALGIIYRDIKPENVLLDDDGHIKLTDFGLAKVLEAPTDTTKTFCGTPEYLAPEVVAGYPHDKAVDWWGLGIIFWELLTGLPPFSSPNVQQIYDMIRSQTLSFPAYISKRARSLIEQLLERDPRRRLGCRPHDDDVEAIKAHPFFEGLDWDALYHKRVPPPWRPVILRDKDADVSNFDREFTSEAVTDSIGSTSALATSMPRFDGFSYQPPPSMLHSTSPHALAAAGSTSM